MFRPLLLSWPRNYRCVKESRVMATRQSVLRAVGAALVWSGGAAVLVFGILFANYDPSLAAPGTEDPRPMAVVAMPISVGAALVGLVLWKLGRPSPGGYGETPPQEGSRGAGPGVFMLDPLSFDTLVIDKKLIGLSSEYRILDLKESQVGTISKEGSGLLALLSSAITLAVYDSSGQRVIGMVCPGDSTVEIADGSGRSVGRIVEQNVPTCLWLHALPPTSVAAWLSHDPSPLTHPDFRSSGRSTIVR
jgi:hypothetical protein